MSKKILDGKKIAIILSFRDFRDIEFFIPWEIFKKTGLKVTTVSSQKGTAIGADGGDVKISLNASELSVDNFDAVVFIGGPGMGKNLDNRDFQKIAKDAAATGKVLGAICIASALLAKAGVLSGRKATVWSSLMDKSAIKILKDGGAVYLEEDVVVDGKIITANGPGASKKFAETMVRLLEGEGLTTINKSIE